ncbi:hypothetical protein [Stenotrophomonas sp.]|uniref:hypothetical protein n=1 Tax=Stenotrophomonas sp. TaxID=69392 RepID=UPI0028A0E745|nr:hypothetical protein [Stenotrophomonas sp.]
MRRAALLVALLLVTGCATRLPPQSPAASYDVNQHRQLLQPEGSTATGGQVQAYQLAASERFRMPMAVQAAEPVLPEEFVRRSLPPTTVCVRVIVDGQGQVQRTEPLLAHSQCGSGGVQANAALLQAALAATAGWVFQPAALCHFAAGVTPASDDVCAGATRVEAVPVTLSYAFTFEVVEGRAQVRSQGGLR